MELKCGKKAVEDIFYLLENTHKERYFVLV
jgi:hypothetical protein